MSIMPERVVGLQEALEALIRHEVACQKVLSIAQAEEMGVGFTKVLLGSDSRYEVYRCGKQAFVKDVATGAEVAFTLEMKQEGKDLYPRARIHLDQLKNRLPGLYRRLTPTGIWQSLKGARPRVYLYRLVYALCLKETIYWSGTNTRLREDKSPNLLAVNHKNGVCCDDRWENLELVTYADHAIEENRRSGEEEELAIRSLFWENEADCAGDDWWERDSWIG